MAGKVPKSKYPEKYKHRNPSNRVGQLMPTIVFEETDGIREIHRTEEYLQACLFHVFVYVIWVGGYLRNFDGFADMGLLFGCSMSVSPSSLTMRSG